MSVPVSPTCRRGSDGCEIKGPHELCGTVVPVSLAQEAVEKARQEIGLAVNRMVLHWEDFNIRPILESLVRSAQLAALESVAKEMCYWCSTRQVPCGHVDCPALAATDFVARLRGTGGQS